MAAYRMFFQLRKYYKRCKNSEKKASEEEICMSSKIDNFPPFSTFRNVQSLSGSKQDIWYAILCCSIRIDRANKFVEETMRERRNFRLGQTLR